MQRLTTDNPQNNVETMLNYAYADESEVAIRYGEHEDQRLCAYIAHRAKVLCDCEMSQEEIMEGSCFECVPDCALGVLNTVAIQAAELRERLKAMEDILGDDYDLDRLRKLVDADHNGRAFVIPHTVKKGDTIYEIRKIYELGKFEIYEQGVEDISKDGIIIICGEMECIPWDEVGASVFLDINDAKTEIERRKSNGREQDMPDPK